MSEKLLTPIILPSNMILNLILVFSFFIFFSHCSSCVCALVNGHLLSKQKKKLIFTNFSSVFLNLSLFSFPIHTENTIVHVAARHIEHYFIDWDNCDHCCCICYYNCVFRRCNRKCGGFQHCRINYNIINLFTVSWYEYLILHVYTIHIQAHSIP